MDNSNSTSTLNEPLTQQTMEIILKLHASGASTETICSAIGLIPAEVIKAIREAAMMGKSSLNGLILDSKEFRCALSNRLMVSPVTLPNGKLYELKCIEEALNSKALVELAAFTIEQANPAPYIKERVRNFSKSALQLLEAVLCKPDCPKEAEEFAAECLSILSPEDDFETCLRVLATTRRNLGRSLIGLLKTSGYSQILLKLTFQLDSARSLPLECLAFVADLMKEETLPFDCLLNILLKIIRSNLTEEAIGIVEETSHSLSLEGLRQVLGQLNSSSQTDEVQFRIDKFAIEVATSCVREGFNEEAMSIVRPLIEKQALLKDLAKFFEYAGCDAELVELFRMAFSHNLAILERSSPPEGLVEVLKSVDCYVKHLHCSTLKDQNALEARTSRIEGDVQAVSEKLSSLANMIKLSFQSSTSSFKDLLKSKDEALKTELSRIDKALTELKEFSRGSREALKASDNQLRKYFGDSIVATECKGLKSEDFDVHPLYIYSYRHGSSSLFWTTLRTGKNREERMRNHTFKKGSVWCEVAGGDIYFTGGSKKVYLKVGYREIKYFNEVVLVSGSSLKVTQKAGMLIARKNHGSVYDRNYLYVIGGYNGNQMEECERLSVSEDRWEVLHPLPQGCLNVSVTVMKETESLYALGGSDDKSRFDVIQRLRLGRLEWDVMPLRLPVAASCIACFSKESKVWFVVGGKLYCLNAATECITLIKQVGEITSYRGPSYYYRGYLYCPKNPDAVYSWFDPMDDAARSIKIGSL